MNTKGTKKGPGPGRPLGSRNGSKVRLSRTVIGYLDYELEKVLKNRPDEAQQIRTRYAALMQLVGPTK